MRSRSSSVSLPHCSFTLPFTCFQLPFMRSQFMRVVPRFRVGAASDRYTGACFMPMPPNTGGEGGRTGDRKIPTGNERPRTGAGPLPDGLGLGAEMGAFYLRGVNRAEPSLV